MKKNYFISRPVLDFCLNLPFLNIGTSLLSSSNAFFVFDYVKLNVRLFKWEFCFRLYKTQQQLMKEEEHLRLKG